jgi:hypothetical protein
MMIKRVKDRLEKLEKTMGIGEPDDNVIIYPLEPGEPERSIERFHVRYPDYKGTLIILPEKEKDERD